MTRRTLLLVAALALAPALWVSPPVPTAQPPAGRLAPRLSGPELFALTTELSEADGFFRSDNLVSNELFMQRVIPALTRIVKPGRVYLGVGPEQNFTYMAAIKPAMAFIIDVRRGNLQLHLLYKALFELSVDRVDFVSRLFSLKRPARPRPQVVGAAHFHRVRRPACCGARSSTNRTSARSGGCCLERTNWSCLRRTSRASKTSTRRSTSAGSASTTRWHREARDRSRPTPS